MKENINCLKCRKKIDADVVIKQFETKRGIKYQCSGVCPVCSTKVSKFVSKTRAEQIQSGQVAEMPSPPTYPADTTKIGDRQVIDYNKDLPMIDKADYKEPKPKSFLSFLKFKKG